MHTNEGLVTAAYVVAAVLFILALGGLSNQEKAKRYLVRHHRDDSGGGCNRQCCGWTNGTDFSDGDSWRDWRLVRRESGSDDSDAGTCRGFSQSGRSGCSLYRDQCGSRDGCCAGGKGGGTVDQLAGFAATIAAKSAVELSILKVELFLGILIGAITFTGSIIAYGKLAGRLSSAALTLPVRHALNLAALVACFFSAISTSAAQACGLCCWSR